MRTFILSMLLTCTYAISFATSNPTSVSQQIQQELSSIITQANVWESEDIGTKIMVKLTINEDNEVIVLSTDNKTYDEQIKALLNYKEIEIEGKATNKIFYLPISLQGSRF